MDVIETVGLARRFGRLDAVNGLNLKVPEGSTFALIGPNGAGKSTTLKLLMNLLKPTGGRAMVLGADSKRIGPAILQRIGYISENQRLPEWMTPSELATIAGRCIQRGTTHCVAGCRRSCSCPRRRRCAGFLAARV